MIKKKTKDLVVIPSKKPVVALDGANRFSFSHENCEKLKRFTPSKTDSQNRFSVLFFVCDCSTSVGINSHIRRMFTQLQSYTLLNKLNSSTESTEQTQSLLSTVSYVYSK